MIFKKGDIVEITHVKPFQADARWRFVGTRQTITSPGRDDLYGPYIFTTDWRWDEDQLKAVTV